MAKTRRKNVKWKTIRLQGNDAKVLSAFMGPSVEDRHGLEAASAQKEIELPDLTVFPTAIKKAEFLLNTAASIEQALMVQYLYAMYSLRLDDEDDQREMSLKKWKDGLYDIAVEEMEHLMMVEIMLLMLGLPLNFERSNIPKDLNPFDFRLEPLSRSSLAKYVITESPPNFGDKDDEDLVAVYEEARKLAKSDAAMMINHVGILYAILAVVFQTAEELEEDADDEWGMTVRAIARSLYKMSNGSTDGWHLSDDDIKDADVGRLVLENYWRDVKEIIDRPTAVAAIKEISIEGEGVGVGDREDSHFDMFFDFFRGDGTLAFPKPGEWSPTLDVPFDPVIDESSNDENAISNTDTIPWAQLGDLQYGLILGGLQEYFYSIADDDRRDAIRDFCFAGGMYVLTSLAEKLVGLPRGQGNEKRAALPFTEPAVVNLPDQEQRHRVLKDQLEAAMEIAQELIDNGNNDRVLNEIIRENQSFLNLLNSQPGDTNPDTDSVDDQAILDLIDTKTPRARNRHRNIDVELGSGVETNLRQLFRDEDSAAILDFLKTGQSTVEPFDGMALVEPGKPNESAFYLHISNDEGAMPRQFDEDEVELVKNWIESMDDKVDPNVGSSETAMAMLKLIERKQPQGRAFHNGVEAGEDQSLSDLFADGDFQGVMKFLLGSEASIEPFADTALIVPGKPDESAFYLHITDPAGVMAGRFRPDEVEIVKSWIEGLASKSEPTDATAAQGDATKPHAPFEIALEKVASGLDRPVFVVSPPGDSKRLFIVEQRGEIKILKLNKGTIVSTPFLKLNGLTTGNEQGLLGMAFHPDFADNGRFYVNCTVRGGKASGGATEIRSYELASKDKADPASKKLIMRIPQPFGNHNAGWMAFGPKDKLLYISTGDGGSGNDPQKNGQNLNSLLGKILRIDVDSDEFPDDDQRCYSIPSSNPFFNVPNTRKEIWAYGLRNPWRCSFDRATGDLFIGDVGQSNREEINFQAATSTGGENYGWRAREGTLDTGLEPNATGPFVDPIFDYGPNDGISVIGGYVYRGNETVGVNGTYFFADFIGRLWSLRHQPGTVPVVQDHTGSLTVDGDNVEDITSFGEDDDGEIYVTTLAGDVLKLVLTNKSMQAGAVNRIASVKIHPAIGIARVGNAGFDQGVTITPADPGDYFIGPERPFETSPPPGGYKRNGRVRRQAARFRLFGYDSVGNLVGEITGDDAEISWTVELANKKASFRIFTGLNKSPTLRNQLVSDENRGKLEIKPGPRTLVGPGKSSAFDTGTFSDFEPNGTEHKVENIYLGEIHSEPSGRLLVLAGEGSAASPRNREITNFVNNDGWYDTIADGPVTATVRLANGTAIEAEPAWVICAPPKFAPALRNVVTLYDVLVDRFVHKEQWLVQQDEPSFRFDIFPILQRAILSKWLLAQSRNFHDFIEDAFPPADEDTRRDVFERLRDPSTPNQGDMNMPMLFDDNNEWERSDKGGLPVTRVMYSILNDWANGDFVDDWEGVAPPVDTDITPAGLDRAALENCSGGGFYPGIEAGWMLRDDLAFAEPFRLDQTNLLAGDISRQMAIPWQADFYKCTTFRGVGWWPQQRPDDVFIEGSSGQVEWIRDKISEHLDMVLKWHELGFVVDNGTRFVETERTDDSNNQV